MARRRKKSRAANRTVSATSTSSAPGPVVLDKSLPALPPHILPSTALTNDGASSTKSSESRESSLTVKSRKEGGRASPARFDSGGTQRPRLQVLISKLILTENLILPASTYSAEHTSLQLPLADELDGNGDDDIFISVSMDQAPASPLPAGERTAHSGDDVAVGPSPIANQIGALSPLLAGSRNAHQDWPQVQSSLDQGEAIGRRNPSSSNFGSAVASPSADTATSAYSPQARSSNLDQSLITESFKLANPPKMRRSSGSRTISRGSTFLSPPPTAGPSELSEEHSSDSSANEQHRSLSPVPRRLDDDSEQSLMRSTVSRKEVPHTASDVAQSFHTRSHSNSVSNSTSASQKPAHIVDFLAEGPPARSAARPNSANRPVNPVSRQEIVSVQPTNHDSPLEPPPSRHKPNESVSSIQSEHFHAERYSTALPAPSPMLDFSMDEEMGRIMRGDETESQGNGLFRRMSKAVRHNRSQSDHNKTMSSPQWGGARTVRNGSIEPGSPGPMQAVSKEEVVQLRNRLNMTLHRITDLEAERNTLQDKITGVVDLRQVNSELRDKRSTMAFLDTQREMVIRELEIMTDHLGRIKASNEPLDMPQLKSDALRDFAESLRKLKETLGLQIEDLVHKKNEISVEIADLGHEKDRVLGDLEITAARNSQLAELNNQLVHNIQELYKHGSRPNGSAPMPIPMSVPTLIQSPPAFNGLGIHQGAMKSDLSLDQRVSVDNRSSADQSISHVSGLSGDTEVASEGAQSANMPQVVSIRKGSQPKKFSWKKSGVVAKNVTKGFKGAFGLNENQQPLREEFTESTPYGSLPLGEAPLAGAAPSPPPSRLGTDQGRQAWAMRQAAAQKSLPLRTTTLPTAGQIHDVTATKTSADSSKWLMTRRRVRQDNADGTEALFGSELTARCDFERRVIPAIVTRCIEEVERRGMSVEGIYRKSGSSTQVKAIQASFERDSTAGNEIANPDLDIHAVTSALKQYLRRLPVPLITWDCYDALMDVVMPEDAVEVETRVKRIKQCIDTLPPRHRDTLEFLVSHLVRVMEQEQQNLVSVPQILCVT